MSNIDVISDEPIGHRLRELRKARRLSLGAVENLSHGEFKQSVLGAYERGEREMTISRLQRLIEVYGTTIEDVFGPSPRPADGDRRAAPESRDRSFTIDLTRLGELPSARWHSVVQYLARIQELRGVQEGQFLTVRDVDVDAMAMAYGVERNVLVDRLRWAGLCPDTASEVSDQAGLLSVF